MRGWPRSVSSLCALARKMEFGDGKVMQRAETSLSLNAGSKMVQI